MRKFFTASFITLAIIIGVTGAASVTYAQSALVNPDGTSIFGTSVNTPTSGGGAPTVDLGSNKAGTYFTDLNTTASPVVQNDGSKTKTDPNLAGDTASQFGTIMTWIMSLFAWLVGVAALTLDYAVYYTVITMGDYIHNLSAIGVTWRILRDLGNIVLIFGFLAVGITTILNVDWYGDRKKMLPMLMIAAIFLNFSLFMTEVVIDTGNLFATQFFTQINGGTPMTKDGLSKITVGTFGTSELGNEGISNKIMSQLGLQTMYNEVRTNKLVLEGGNTWIIAFMGIILFIITAFVMFSLAFILIARFVILVFVIIFSPIGFAGLAVPSLASTASKWWDMLFKQTLTAPVLLLLLYIALAVITDAGFLTSGSKGNWSGFLTSEGLTGFAGLILSFLVAMGLLLIVTISAKNLSAVGANWATKTAGMLSFGTTAWGMRTLGGGGGRLLNSRWVQSKAAKGGVSGTLLAKPTAFIGRQLENRTYDIRNVKTAQGLLSGAALGYNTGVAPGSSMTAKEAVKKATETVEKHMPFSGDWWRDQQKEYEKAAAEVEREKNLATPGTPDFAKAINKMSDDELTELKGIRQGLESFVGVLSPAKYATVSKSPKLLDGEKKKLGQAWDNQFAVVTPPGGGAPINNAAATIGRFNTEEVAGLSGSVLTKPNVVEVLGNTELDAIRRKGSLNKQQRHDIFDQMTSPAASPALAAVVADYFLPANDPGGSRLKYWNV